MQTKLHCWAAADPGRRFDDLFNLVCDPATLLMAFVALASAALFLGAGGSIKGIWTTTNTQLTNANSSAS